MNKIEQFVDKFVLQNRLVTKCIETGIFEKPEIDKEVFQWWLVDSNAASILRLYDEYILSNEYGNWWGRTQYGAPVEDDSVFYKIFDLTSIENLATRYNRTSYDSEKKDLLDRYKEDIGREMTRMELTKLCLLTKWRYGVDGSFGDHCPFCIDSYMGDDCEPVCEDCKCSPKICRNGALQNELFDIIDPYRNISDISKHEMNKIHDLFNKYSGEEEC